MAQTFFGSDATPDLGDLDANFTDLYTDTSRLSVTGTATGFGTTPSAWGGFYEVIELANGAHLQAETDATPTVYLGLNNYWSGSAWLRNVAAAASTYFQVGGQHVWWTAASGAAGSAITWNQAAMKLDASQNLLVGTSASWAGNTSRCSLSFGGGAYGLTVQTAGTTGRAVNFLQGGASDGTGSPTSVGSITVSTTATAYNTSSDYRLKDNVQPIADSGAFVDALKPCTWTWKSNGAPGAGFIAHELQQVSPGSVSGTKDAVQVVGDVKGADGEVIAAGVERPTSLAPGQTWTGTTTLPVYQSVEYGSAEVIAMLVAEVKSLRARMAALEAA
jgi:hypothetical protein